MSQTFYLVHLFKQSWYVGISSFVCDCTMYMVGLLFIYKELIFDDCPFPCISDMTLNSDLAQLSHIVKTTLYIL